MKNLYEGRNKMKTSMKKNVKAFLAILFSAVLVFEAWGATSVVSNKATSTQSVVNTTSGDMKLLQKMVQHVERCNHS